MCRYFFVAFIDFMSKDKGLLYLFSPNQYKKIDKIVLFKNHKIIMFPIFKKTNPILGGVFEPRFLVEEGKTTPSYLFFENS